ncbi:MULTISPECIES: lipoprotein-releasing ABC transporter permease subunit [unclassified Commensalibacter]|uniref:lipoprotein-releasing ABC transporter permease subunit n=1 Tax=unclassified Commensalibacter TaxID=2630218 RepID=UPI0018DCE045|nr:MULTISPECIES: lipoprotein-releasing ABC transporter permease subunit [unclassified Commensalibacter]MBH9970038.1 lipoprotein-releasing ABC transporter permease subunit [Commensalibacter sp. M0265]MBH9977066.1 lipoprotein-releasing ABC transporter permease subunit [Commensalibacter sp. M0266]MBH9993073.1 lipoprotein-releasing ABC transporter permease subunit [Commensalibacter sp. M0270]MBI0046242.1 lipoprotein-releasing ABC transporter permease subunit [Commensalibacter sp. M0267]MBI0056238.
MFGSFERMVAKRYLRARKGERFVSIIAIFSLIGIALGVGTLIVVMAVMNGFKADLLGRILGLNGDLSVYSQSYDGPTSLRGYNNLSNRIEQMSYITSAIPFIEGQVLINAGNFNSGGMVRGMTASGLKKLKVISKTLDPTVLKQFQGDDVIIIGETLAEQANLGVGSRLTLISPKGSATVMGNIPRIKSYRIIGIFDSGMHEYNSSYVFLPMRAAQKYFQLNDEVTGIQIFSNDSTHIQAVTHQLENSFRNDNLKFVDWTQSNNAFFGAVQVEQNVMFLILALIILVAAFNVISSLIMMVKDKTRDIAILRTMGASRGAIMRIFLMCGASVGVTGTLIGTVLGILFCKNIEHIRQGLQKITGTNLFNPEVYYLEHLPAKLDWSDVIQVVSMALFLSLLATLYPSWKAAKTDPVEALRNE